MQEAFVPPTGIGSFQDQANRLAEMGRNGDVYIVHAAEGETVVPMEVFDANPELKAMIWQQMREMDLEPERYVVGNELNSINPKTGQPEFFLKKLWSGVKKVLKVAAPVIGAIAGSFIPGVGPILGPAIGSFLGGKLAGNSTKSALMGAALAGLGGYGLSQTAAGIGSQGIGSLSGNTLGTNLYNSLGSGGLSGVMSMPTPSLGGATAPTGFAAAGNAVAPAAAPASSLGAAAGGIGKWAMANPGTALMGGSMLLSMLDKPEKVKIPKRKSGADLLAANPDKYLVPTSSLVPAPISTVDASYDSLYGKYPQFQLPQQPQMVQPTMNFPVVPTGAMVVNAASGGEIAGPGTGVSDSIPAMLSDGEFVMTAKAVKGMGGGDRRRGAAEMYKMMKKYEALHG